MTVLEDEAAAFTVAAGWAADRIGSITRWDVPGQGDWDMRALVGHTINALLTVEQYITIPAESESADRAEAYYEAAAQMVAADEAAVLQRGIDAGVALGDDPAAAFADIADRVPKLLTGHPDALIRTIAGGMWLRNYLPTRTFELVVHGLDICAAAGLPADPPEPALRRTLELATSLAVRRGDGPCVLFAFTGRSALPTGFSVL